MDYPDTMTDDDNDSEVAEATGMSDDDIRAFINDRESRAERPEIAAEQALAMDYYLRRPMGNEEEGRSQVISSDVWDVVEGLTPQVVEPFISTPDLVSFNATGQEDEEAAKQESDYVGYVITQRNDAFIQFVAWVKCGLLLKNGVVKWWWDTTHRVTIETYRGITADILASLKVDPEVTIINFSENPPEQPIPDLSAQQAPMLGGPPDPQGAQPGMQQDMQPDMAAPPPEPTYDVRVRVRRKDGFARYEVVPPEELLVIGRDPNIGKASFVQHRTRMTLSDLRELGYDIDEDIDDGGQGDVTMSVVYTSRNASTDPMFNTKDDSPTDPSLREVWFRESYCRVDVDGDGIAELRKICMVGDKVLAKDEVEEIPFASWTPYQQLFQYDGRSPADETLEVQDIKTTLLRQLFDNIYTINNNRVFAGPDVDLDDLLDNQIAGVVRTKGKSPISQQVMALPVVPLGPIIQPAIEYTDEMKENRTGFSRYNQGSADLGNQKTLGEVQLVTGMSGRRSGLIVRSLAEQGMKPLMLGMHGLLRRHATKAETVRLRGKWVQIDPRSWRERMDMSVSVGLGTMDKQTELATSQELLKMQAGLAPAGIVTPENQYNAASKFVTLTGEKNPDKYFTHPEKMPKQAPPDPMQDPKVMLAVAGHKLEAEKVQRELDQRDRELDQADRALDQVDQKQGIESTNAQFDAAERLHKQQLATEAHVRDMQAPHPQELAANAQSMQADQQAKEVQEPAETAQASTEASQ